MNQPINFQINNTKDKQKLHLHPKTWVINWVQIPEYFLSGRCSDIEASNRRQTKKNSIQILNNLDMSLLNEFRDRVERA